MSAAIGPIMEAVKKLTDFCKELVGIADAEKYADGVEKLNKEVENTFSKMREVIVNDDSLTADEKLEKLNKLADRQEAAQKNREKAVEGNRESVLKVIKEIVFALTTCGIYCLWSPKFRKKNTKQLQEAEEILEIEEK